MTGRIHQSAKQTISFLSTVHPELLRDFWLAVQFSKLGLEPSIIFLLSHFTVPDLTWRTGETGGRDGGDTVKCDVTARGEAVFPAFARLLNGSCHLPSGWRRQTRRLPFPSAGQKTHIISNHSWLLWRAATAASPERLTHTHTHTHTHTRTHAHTHTHTHSLISYSTPHCCCWGSLACTDSLRAYDWPSTESSLSLK